MRALKSNAVLCLCALIGLLSNLSSGPSFAGAVAPLALHQNYAVGADGTVELNLKSYDLDGDKLTAKIITLPSTGTLSLLTPNYLTHSILPKTVPTLSITSSMLPYVLPSSSLNRVLYTSSSPKSSLSNPEGACPSFTYTVSDATSTSLPGTVRLLPSSDLVVYSSTFSRDGQQWSVSQSGSASAPASLRAPKAATYEASQRGALNHYVYGNDESVNGGFKTTTVDPTGLKALDGDLWAFQSPKSAGVGQLFNAAYGGTLSFTVSSFSGDFSDGSRHDAGGREHLLPLVTLKCPQCKNGKGTTIVFPLSKRPYDGKGGMKVEIPLKETAGWQIDPKNTLVKNWSAPSTCDFIEVLTRLSSFDILGDFTSWYEAIGIDDIKVKAAATTLSKPREGGRNGVPVCAQATPDASVCTC